MPAASERRGSRNGSVNGSRNGDINISRNGSGNGAQVVLQAPMSTSTTFEIVNDVKEVVRSAKLHVSFLIDVSGSMAGGPIQSVIEQLNVMLKPGGMMKTGTRIDINVFNSECTKIVRFMKAGHIDCERLASQVLDKVGSTTALYDGVLTAVDMMRSVCPAIGTGDTDDAWHRFLIVFTDGGDCASKASLLDAQQALKCSKMSNFNVYLIAAGVAAQTMAGLVTGHDRGHYLPIQDCSAAALKSVFARLKEKMYQDVMRVTVTGSSTPGCIPAVRPPSGTGQPPRPTPTPTPPPPPKQPMTQQERNKCHRDLEQLSYDLMVMTIKLNLSTLKNARKTAAGVKQMVTSETFTVPNVPVLFSSLEYWNTAKKSLKDAWPAANVKELGVNRYCVSQAGAECIANAVRDALKAKLDGGCNVYDAVYQDGARG